jgi:hypothetical protein
MQPSVWIIDILEDSGNRKSQIANQISKIKIFCSQIISGPCRETLIGEINFVFMFYRYILSYNGRPRNPVAGPAIASPGRMFI